MVFLVSIGVTVASPSSISSTSSGSIGETSDSISAMAAETDSMTEVADIGRRPAAETGRRGLFPVDMIRPLCRPFSADCRLAIISRRLAVVGRDEGSLSAILLGRIALARNGDQTDSMSINIDRQSKSKFLSMSSSTIMLLYGDDDDDDDDDNMSMLSV
eukprot:m.60567 g.60567  ORF g.60567 m.60567 type:complete len:159 (-) comp13294_c0_seq1:215-691(-)